MAIKRSLPTRNADSAVATNPSRTGAYLEAYTLPLGAGNWAFADEGSYFHASNATVGTGVAGHAAPVVADTSTKPLLHLYNGGVKSVVLDYLQLQVTAAGTAGTITYAVVYIDNAGATARTSGGTAVTPVNCNSASTDTSAATLFFGPVVAAFTSGRKVAQAMAREVIPVVQDTFTLKFGAGAAAPVSGITTAGTATNHLTLQMAPVVVGAGGNVGITLIRASQSAAASYQFSLGYWER